MRQCRPALPGKLPDHVTAGLPLQAHARYSALCKGFRLFAGCALPLTESVPRLVPSSFPCLDRHGTALQQAGTALVALMESSEL